MSSHPRFHASARIGAVALTCALVLSACSGDPATLTPTPSPSGDDTARVSATANPSPEPDPSAPLIIGGAPTADVVEREVIANGLEAPWDLEFMSDGSILVSERDTAAIKRIRSGVATALNGPGSEALRSIVDNTGEAGLLGIALHPDDETLLYAYVTRGDGNAVIRMDLQGDLLSAPVDVVTSIPKARNHDGGRIAFGPDGFLYIATGDAAKPELSQDLTVRAGKILRVIADGSDKDGTAAPGNPFGSRVWSYGHRNVQGLGWVADGRMYASELGQNDTDELNLIEPGANYGWPEVEARIGAPSGTELGETTGGFTYPVAEWSTDDASPSGIAVTNEAVYVSALRGERVWRVPLTGDGVGRPHVLLDDLGRIRHIEAGPDGALYVVTNNTDGRGDPRPGDDTIVRIVVD